MKKINCTNPNHKDSRDCYKYFKSELSWHWYLNTPESPTRFRNPKELLLDCQFVKLKTLLVKLRRSKGSNTPDVKTEKMLWIRFKTIFESNHDYYINILNERWLISILDTYIDHGDAIESRNALIATMIHRWETILMEILPSDNNQLLNLSSNVSNGRYGDLNIFITRQHLLIADSPVIEQIFIKFIITKMLDEHSSIYSYMKNIPQEHNKYLMELLQYDYQI